MVELSILCDKVRYEEKSLYEKAQSKGIKSKIVDANIPLAIASGSIPSLLYTLYRLRSILLLPKVLQMLLPCLLALWDT